MQQETLSKVIKAPSWALTLSALGSVAAFSRSGTFEPARHESSSSGDDKADASGTLSDMAVATNSASRSAWPKMCNSQKNIL